MMENLTELDLDIIDLQLLDALQHDASISNQALADKVHVSPPTCLRRVKRLHALGLIERTVSILNADALRPWLGAGLTAIVEVTLEQQSAEQQGQGKQQNTAQHGLRATTLTRVSSRWPNGLAFMMPQRSSRPKSLERLHHR